MAGISRSVTITIAYLMAHFGMSMHSAYQFVKQKRPTISPNLNFMGQLVEFERELELNPHHDTLNVDDFLPSPEQERLSEKMKGINSNGSSAESSPEPNRTQDGIPFVLKLPAPKGKKAKNKAEPQAPTVTMDTSSPPLVMDSQLRCNIEASSSTAFPVRVSSPWSTFPATASANKKSPVLRDLEQSGNAEVQAKVKSFERLSFKSSDIL